MLLFFWRNCGNCRCCCGRRENQHGKLTIVEEENEEAEAAKEAEEEGTESSENEDEVVQSEERVKLGGRGLYYQSSVRPTGVFYSRSQKWVLFIERA